MSRRLLSQRLRYYSGVSAPITPDIKGEGFSESKISVYNPDNKEISLSVKKKLYEDKLYMVFHITGDIKNLKSVVGRINITTAPLKKNLTSGLNWYNMPEYVGDDTKNYPMAFIAYFNNKDKDKLFSLLNIKQPGKLRWVHYPNPIVNNGEKFNYEITKVINPVYPVYIISKGRWESRQTVKALEEDKVPYKIVIEQSEFKQYSEVIDPNKILILPESFIAVETKKFKLRSSIPARNFVWHHAVKSGANKHWILDDNIAGFYRWNMSHRFRIKSGVLFKLCEDYVGRYKNILQSGMNYLKFYPSRSPMPPVTYNTRIYSCILNDHRIDKLVDNIRWKNMNFNEDTDLSLRILKKGYATCLFNAFLCNKATNLTVKGGNTETQYTIGNDPDKPIKKNILLKAQTLVNEHPDVARVVKRFERGYHHEVNYNSFKENILGYTDPKIFKGVNEYNMKLVKVNPNLK